MIGKIDSFEAYVSMYEFLSEIYEREPSDILGGILGDIRINPADGNPMDSAMKQSWFEAMRKEMGDEMALLSLEDAYRTMLVFVENLAGEFVDTTLVEMVNALKASGYVGVQHDWTKAVEKVLSIYR